VVFANLAAFTKMVIDVEDGRIKPSATQKDRLTQAGLLKHFNDIGQQSVMLEYRPDIDDFYFDDDAAAKMRRLAKDKDEHYPDNDDLIGCIRPPPGVDSRKMPSNKFDDWKEAGKSNELFVIKKKGKGKAAALSRT
jgi:hypothetical protein